MYISPKTAVGVYSDSGLNGVEVCLSQTDGVDFYDTPLSFARPYPAELKARILAFLLKKDFTDTREMLALDEEITAFHLSVFQEFYAQHARRYPQIDVIGYSGHVVYHRPQEKICITLGNPEKMAVKTGIPVLSRFIQSDLKSGGQGGPLFASFYEALVNGMEKPIGIVSLGGITTLTVIGSVGEVQAFDVGIGTLLLDHWVREHTGSEMDYDGLLAAKGKIDQRLLAHLLKEPFFQLVPPKTVDKNEFTELYKDVQGCSVADGAATLTAMIAHSVVQARNCLSMQPKQWILIGGGVYNPVLVRHIRHLLKEPVETGLSIGWQNETLNAQAYAFLAVRSLFGLPISYPTTTGVKEAVSGGILFSK